MKKKSLDEDIFDAVLVQAFTEAVAEEFADVPEPGMSCSYTPKNKRSGGKRRIAGLLIAAAVVGLAVWLVWMWLSPDGYSIETPEYVYGYIPEEYVVTNYDDRNYIRYDFENAGDGTYIDICCYPIKGTSISVDNEYSTITESIINGYTVYLVTFPETISNVKTIYWSDGYSIFQISGNGSEKLLFKIAEHIKRKPQ